VFLSFDLIDYLLHCSSVIHSLKHCLSELTKTKTKTKTKINLKLKKHWRQVEGDALEHYITATTSSVGTGRSQLLPPSLVGCHQNWRRRRARSKLSRDASKLFFI